MLLDQHLIRKLNLLKLLTNSLKLKCGR